MKPKGKRFGEAHARVLIKRQLRKLGVPIPEDAMYDIGKLRELLRGLGKGGES